MSTKSILKHGYKQITVVTFVPFDDQNKNRQNKISLCKNKSTEFGLAESSLLESSESLFIYKHVNAVFIYTHAR